MSYTDLTSEFSYKDLVFWQNMDALAENDKFIRELYSKYRRPNLVYVSATEVDVENNTSTLHETELIFNDNEKRTVFENTGTSSKFRRATMTESAEFQSGTENSGRRSGLTESVNTWYAIYAVKSQIDTTKFVLVIDDTMPIRTNYTVLNSRYGENSWLYLGLIRNGDNAVATGDILSFVQSGEKTILTSYYDWDSSGYDTPGIMFCQDALNSKKWTYSAGTGPLQVPQNVGHLLWHCLFYSTNQIIDIADIENAAETITYFKGNNDGFPGLLPHMTQELIPPEEGIHMYTTLGADKPRCSIMGWFDSVLGFGFNPKI